MKRMSFLTLVLAALLLLPGPVSEIRAQYSSPVSIGATLVSRYVWRGVDFGASPSIQPSLSASFGGFTLGAWGAYAVNLTGAQEMDLYASYTFANNMLTATVTDYFFPNELGAYNWFDWTNDSSGHILEASASFNGTSDLPLTALFGVNFYGDNSYYVELGYTVSMLNFFVGAGNGVYTLQDRQSSTDGSVEDVFGIVNLGITASKNIQVTENYSFPVYTSLITNPNAKLIHLVVGVSF